MTEKETGQIFGTLRRIENKIDNIIQNRIGKLLDRLDELYPSGDEE